MFKVHNIPTAPAELCPAHVFTTKAVRLMEMSCDDAKNTLTNMRLPQEEELIRKDDEQPSWQHA